MTVTQEMEGRFQLVWDEGTKIRTKDLDGVGPKTAKRLADRGLHTQADLLLWTPRKYQSLLHFAPASEIMARRSANVEFYAPITSVQKPSPTSRAPVEVVVEYQDQLFKLVWFNMARASFVRKMKNGVWLHVKGSVDYGRYVPTLAHPTFQILDDEPELPDPFVSIEPVYPTVEGVADHLLRNAIIQSCRNLLPSLRDIVPPDSLERHELPGVAQALSTIHLLRDFDDVEYFQQELERARSRLVYEEFFTLQHKLAVEYRDQRERAEAPACTNRDLGRTFVRSLPFKLTGDQASAIATIAEDLGRTAPMRRLLQGDVGSGKTVVALMAAAICVGSGYQVAIMAPTDILARQHWRRAQEFFGELDIHLGFLGGSLKTAPRREVLEGLQAGTLDIVFGTHALFQEDVSFLELGLVIVDEQHKFGVEQRQTLLEKGTDPHLLAMTATPIPRSLAHSVFGDLDLTILREKPPGRKPIRTVLRDRSRAPKVYDYVKEHVLSTREQVYFVYPMVEASEVAPHRKNVTEAAAELAEGPLSGLRVGVLHGRMDGEDKESTMQAFARGELDVLCATTVIEVGVDVSNATLMIIENPEVFGLSQLHQLRGRVGRGESSSMCVLLSASQLSADARERLGSFVHTDDGFELAEADLRLRGPGLFLGLRQAGHAEFRFGDLFRDDELLRQARIDARRLILAEDDSDDDDDELSAS